MKIIILLFLTFGCLSDSSHNQNSDGELGQEVIKTVSKKNNATIDTAMPDQNTSSEISKNKPQETKKDESPSGNNIDKKIKKESPNNRDHQKIDSTHSSPVIKKVINDSENNEITDDSSMDDSAKIHSEPDLKKTTDTGPPIIQGKPDHSLWDALLKKYVSSSGKVNYQGIKSEGNKLDNYLEELKNNPIQNSWSRNEKMAYLINVYNAFTVKLIINNYPVKSIMDLHGGKPWDVKWIVLGDKNYSLNQIENDILRPQYNEPRIHFAVNCAAISCPPLLNLAWTSDNLNTLLEKQAKKFINNGAYNNIKSNSIQVSKIFQWYSVDFDDLIQYLNKYSNIKIEKGAKVSFQEYDWALNG